LQPFFTTFPPYFMPFAKHLAAALHFAGVLHAAQGLNAAVRDLGAVDFFIRNSLFLNGNAIFSKKQYQTVLTAVVGKPNIRSVWS
jgi:hypothetical protein